MCIASRTLQEIIILLSKGTTWLIAQLVPFLALIAGYQLNRINERNEYRSRRDRKHR